MTNANGPVKAGPITLLRVIWPQLAGIAALLVLSACSVWLMSAARAYVGGEGLWSKAQKNAVMHLLRYIDTGDVSDRQKYMAAINVTLGDARARIELEEPTPDYAAVREGFIQGRNHPDDINGMIGLFRWFRHYPKLDQAIGLWASADDQIAKLQSTADEVDATLSSPLRTARAPFLRANVLEIDEKLAPLEDGFSRAVAEAARELSSVLLLIQLLSVGSLLILGVKVSKRIMDRASSAENRAKTLGEQLQFATLGSSDGLWDWNLQTDAVFFSEQFRHQLGYTNSKEFENFDLWKEIHPDEAGRLGRAVREHLRFAAVPFDEECRIRSKGGVFLWVHLRGKATRDATGKAVRLSGSMADISRRVEIEKALIESEELQKALFEAANDVILVLDQTGTIRFANPAVLRIFGHHPKAVIGQPISILQPERLRAAHDAGFQRYLETSVRKLDWRQSQAIGLHKDGHEFPVELSFCEVPLKGGRMFAAFMRDTTQLKLAQSEMERARLLLDATQSIARVGGWEVHASAGNEVYWTEQMYRMLDLPPRQQATSLAYALGFFEAQSRQMMEGAIHNAIENGISFEHEVQMVSAKGKWIWVYAQCGLEIKDSMTARMRVTLRDITAQKTALEAQRLAWDVQKNISQQLEMALHGAEVALWGFVPETGIVTHAQRWDLLLGYAQMPVTLDAWTKLVHPEDRRQWADLMEQHLKGRSSYYEAQYRMKHSLGHWVSLRCRGRVTSYGDDGKPLHYSGAVVDISTEITARQVMHDQHQFLQAMIEGVDTGVVVSTESTVIYSNASFLRMLGYEPDEHLEGAKVEALLANDDLAIVKRLHKSLKAGVPVPVGLFRLKMKTGALLQVALNLSRVMWNGKPHFIGTATALSEHDMLEVLVRSTQSRFNRVLVSELEAQQAHIARELHDSLGSELAGLSLVLGGTLNLAAPDSQIAKQLTMTLQLVKSAAEVTRALARGLLPVNDHPGAFWRSLEQLTSDLALVKGIACTFDPEGDLDQISSEIGNHLYRVAQEASANAIRHGKATELIVQLYCNDQHLRMSIIDNGSGFDPSQISANHMGVGARSMMARVRTFGGRIQFLKTDTGGCEVRVTWIPQDQESIEAEAGAITVI